MGSPGRPAPEPIPLDNDVEEAEASTNAELLAAIDVWADILRIQPDPARVKDKAILARIADSGLPWRVRERRSGITMVLVPGGSFQMGSPANEAGRYSNEHLHTRLIESAFYLAETELTASQWSQVMSNKPIAGKKGSLPKTKVSWRSAQKFLDKVGHGLRLPSEAEWEYACRAGTTTPYAFGRTLNKQQAAFRTDPKARNVKPIRCGIRSPNPWGLFDMHGNVDELCQDSYAEQSPSHLGQIAFEEDGNKHRVVRGGNAGCLLLNRHRKSSLRSAARAQVSETNTSSLMGLRVARTALLR